MTCAALLGAVLWVGCASTFDIQVSNGSGGTAGVGGGGGTSDADGQPPDLGPDAFACNVTEINCVLDAGHLGWPIPREALELRGKARRLG